MAEFYDWSTLEATNNFAPPNGAPENMDYRDVNDTIRELMAQQARWRESVRGAVTTGGAQPAYTFTAPQTLGAYAVGQIFTFIAHADSTGAVTLNVSAPGALGARNVIDSRGVQLGSGDIKQNGVYTVITTASTFRVIGHLSQTSLRTLIQNTLNKAYTTTNIADAYSITTDNPITAYATGQLFAFTANFTNTTTAPTLNVDAVGAGALQDTGGSALGVGTIVSGQTYLVVRTASAFRVIAGLAFNGILPVVSGGTGSNTQAGARTNLGLGTGDSPQFAGLSILNTASVIVEQGRVDGTATATAYDFHTGATVVDYDSRIVATGGTGVAGGGALDILTGSGLLSNNAVPIFTNIPQNSKSAAYTTVLADAQKHILHPTADNNARTFTIDSNANVAYPIGTAITFVNQINTVTISITSDTLTLQGSGATGNRTLAANGIATALKIEATKWVISGTGIT